MPNPMAPSIIVNDSNPTGALKMSSTNGATLSATNIFLKNPKAINVIPNFRFEL